MKDKTYTDPRQLLEDLRGGLIPRSVFIEVDVEHFLAELMGQRFTGPNGNVVSMESVRLRLDPRVVGYTAEPLLVSQELADAPTE